MRKVKLGALCRVLVLAIAPAFLASIASAQIVEKSRTLADLLASHPCNSGLSGRHTIVTDCDAADDLGNGGGAFSCFARCDGVDTWSAVAIGAGGGGGPASALASAVVIEGTTDDAFEGNFTFADPTADWTWAWGAAGDLVGAGSLSIDNLKLDGNAFTTITPAATTGATAAGQALAITASPAVASTDTAGAAAGGSVTITAGAAARNTSGNANGGNINLVTGAGIGTGTLGQVFFPNGTTSAPAISTAADPGSGFSFGSGLIRFYIDFTQRLYLDSTAFNVAVPMFGLGTAPSSGFLRSVEANTAGSGSPNLLVDAEAQKVLTNEGATAENYHTLPTAVAGSTFTFVVQDADGIRITAATGDTIRPIAGTAASATGGFIRCATQGAFITLVAINNTEWVSIGSAGVWTIDI